MAWFDDVFEGGLGPGLAVGIGAAVLLPVLRPVLLPVLRPAAKAVIKAGLMAYERAQDAMAYVSEAAGDLAAEARSEMQEAGGTEAR